MILDSFSLKGKSAIVTGSSTGLGQGICFGFAEAGADIVGVGMTEPIETKKYVESLGRRFIWVKADLTSIQPIDNIVEVALKEFGSIDILVNNAGIIRREDAVNFTEEDWDDVMNLNLKSLFFLSQAVGKVCIKQGRGGKIINVASMLSYQGGIRVASYTSSKSGVLGLTRVLANEWAKYNINVNGIAPGYMETNNTIALREDKKRNKEILDRIPAGKWGSPSDLAGAAVFLASDASNYINGFTIAVDGGWLSR